MKLFNQIDFSGGLDAEFDRTKTPNGSYPLLINGRVRDGVISPVKRHRKDVGLPSGSYQDLTVVGDYLLVIIDGYVWYRNVSISSSWAKVPTWTALTGSEVHSKVMPVTTNVYNRIGTPDSVTQSYNPFIAQTEQCLFVTDNVEQPRALFYNLSWKALNTYSAWNQNDSEYVPICYLPQVSGTKAFYVSADKKKVYPSVSGRCLDCVINIDSNGDKGGDADTTAFACDFNDITSIHAITGGGLLLTTLYATYLAQDTGESIFGEPVYRPELAFPIGAVNQYSFADLVGDTAFITQGGINSFNVARQLNRDSNNFPVSKRISRYLVNPQTDTCACNFDDYALFAINTTVGRAVAVYDTVRGQFVSLDTDFGIVKRFAVYRKAGVTKLFFINTDNELYEAYASEKSNIARLLLGDFILTGDGVDVQHKITEVSVVFTGVNEDGYARLALYSDDALVDSAEITIAAATVTPPAPVFVPFIDKENTVHAVWGTKAVLGYKTSLFLEWSGDAKFGGITMSGDKSAVNDKGISSIQELSPVKFAVIGEPYVHNLIHSCAVITDYTDLVVGNRYYVSGSANVGNALITDGAFTARGEFCRLAGKLYDITDFDSVLDAVFAEKADHLLTLGNCTDGTDEGYDRFANLAKVDFNGPAGNLDWAINSGQSWFEHHERYGKYIYGDVEVYVLSGDASEPDGITSTSNQALWLKYWLSVSAARYKVILLHYPPYSDLASYSSLRWPFKEWGADLVISAHTKAYERFYELGFPYIVMGAGGDFDTLPSTDTSVKRIQNTAGYLVLSASKFALNVEFKSVDGTILDATTVYSS